MSNPSTPATEPEPLTVEDARLLHAISKFTGAINNAVEDLLSAGYHDSLAGLLLTSSADAVWDGKRLLSVMDVVLVEHSDQRREVARVMREAGVLSSEERIRKRISEARRALSEARRDTTDEQQTEDQWERIERTLGALRRLRDLDFLVDKSTQPT